MKLSTFCLLSTVGLTATTAFVQPTSIRKHAKLDTRRFVVSEPSSPTETETSKKEEETEAPKASATSPAVVVETGMPVMVLEEEPATPSKKMEDFFLKAEMEEEEPVMAANAQMKIVP